MRHIFHESLMIMESAFVRLEKQVPPPQNKKWKDGFVARYLEETLQQALILKLARTISGLHAVDLLLLHGFLQEEATLHRILDEIFEDILFLSAAITNDEITKRHEQYLAAFWAEEFPDPENTLARHKKPNSPPRRKIRAYINRVLVNPENPSLLSDVGESISSTYSGYVHASAPQVMDMYGGNPPHFHISGMKNTPRMQQHIDDAWNYFYRGFLSVVVVGKAFGDKELVDELNKHIKRFIDLSGDKANMPTVE